jgi:broad specificity phosphatase PhoE
MMPIRLLLIRHGESEGNLGHDVPELAKRLSDVPDNELRLSKLGVEQAIKAGQYVRKYFEEDESFTGRTVGFVSPFIRAKETAGHLGLGLQWKDSPFIVERDWGHFSELDAEEQSRFKANKKRNPLYACMPNGQSLSGLLNSNYLFFGKLHREHSEDRVVAVCHGERLLTIRYMLERMSDKEFGRIIRSRAKSDQVRNTQIVEYCRKDPETSTILERYEWMRSFCPWDLREKDLIWKPILRPRMNDSELIADAEEFPRYLED